MRHPLSLRPPAAAALGLLLAASPACAQDGPPAPAAGPLPLEAFAYDRSAPLDLREAPFRVVEGAEVTAISFASPKGGRATGLLFVPTRQGPHAGIVLQHGMPGSASEMFGHGVQLARHGAVAVALDAPFTRRGGTPVRFTAADSAEQVQLIVDLQRAVDLLLARREVDPARLAYVGRSYGGAMGALLAGVERRLKGYVLMVGDGGLVAHFTGPDDRYGPLQRLSADERRRWLAAMGPIEPSRFVGRAPPAAILFQSGRRDELVPVADAEALHRAAGEPGTVLWYDAGHDLGPRALADQLRWLHRVVGTDAPARR